MKTIRLHSLMAGPDGVFSPGIHRMEDKLADALIASGQAEAVKAPPPVETKAEEAAPKEEAPQEEAPPPVETASETSDTRAKTNPFARGKKKGS